ncbi:MAG: hypothetical protein CMJ49_00925 [Planctomycetaceae bacterium]|nr:hypothetical protein [Planctomycetaceae bacterium]
MGLIVGMAMAIAAAPVAAEQEKVQLGMRLEPGQTFRFRMLNEQRVERSLPRRKMTTQQSIGWGWTMKVLGVDEKGNAEVKITYHWVRVTQKSEMGSYVYDSDRHDPDKPVIPEVTGFVGMLGESFIVTFDPAGRALAVRSHEEMVEEVLDRADVPDGETRDEQAERLKTKINEAQVKNTLSLIAAIYPNQPVGVGDHWKRKSTSHMGFTKIIDSTYSVTGRKAGMMTVAVDSAISTPEDVDPMQDAAARETVEMKGMQKGSMQINESTGMLMDMRMTQSSAGIHTIRMAEMPEPIVLPMQFTATVRFALEDVILAEMKAASEAARTQPAR